MFFILSKTVNYLAQPLTIIFILWVLSYFLRRKSWSKYLRYSSITLLVFFSNSFIINEVNRLYEKPVTPIRSITKVYEYGILLTGITAKDKELDDRIYTTSSPDRVNHSLLLYKRGIIKKILISGGSGLLLNSNYSEANQLFNQFVLMGVDSADLVVEGESRNTYESAVAVKKMLQYVTTPASCLLITSGYHIPRSSLCFKKQNWDCDTFATDIRAHKREFTPDVLFIHKVEAIYNWQILMKEWVGIMAYWISGYI